jgi:hypothetical protein
VHADIVENTAEQRKTQQVLAASSTAWVPSKRFMYGFMYGLATATAAFGGTTIAKLLFDYVVLPRLVTILPFLIFMLTT